MNPFFLVSFTLYFIVFIVIGIYSQRFSSRGISEFYVGAGKLNKSLVAVSAVSSGRTSWLLLIFIGQVYSMGISAVWAVAGYILVELLLFLFYAPRIRNLAGKNECITVPDLYASVLKDDKGYLRIFLIFIFIILMIGFISAQFVNASKTFYTNVGMNQTTGIILTATIVLFYTIMGGFLSVCLTDVFQSFMVLISFLLLALYSLTDIGGIHEAIHRLQDTDQEIFNPRALSIGVMTGFIGIGLGSPGSPHIINRYMSIKDPSQFRWTAIAGTSWNLLLVLGALLVGILARAYFPNIESLAGKDPGNALFTLSNAVLPPVFTGLVIASVIGAIMSAADSYLLISASSIIRDFYEKILNKRKRIPQFRLVFFSRIAIIILVYIAIILGMFAEKVIHNYLLFAWTGLVASIGPTLLLTIFWKKTSTIGVLAGIITGIITVIFWKLTPGLNQLTHELIPAFFLAWALTMLISVIDKRSRIRRKEKIFKIRKMTAVSFGHKEKN